MKLQNAIKANLFFFLAGATIWLYYYFAFPDAPYSHDDASGYINYAERWIKEGFGLWPGRTFGYPALLYICRICGASLHNVFHIQILLHLASVWLLTDILRLLKISLGWRKLFFIAGSLPLFTSAAFFILTETFAQFWLVVGAYFIVQSIFSHKHIWLLVASFAFMMAAFTRPTYQMITIPLAFILWLGTIKVHKIKVFLYLCVPCIACILIYSSYNKKTYGFSGLTPYLPYNLFVRTRSFADKLPEKNKDIREILIKHQDTTYGKERSVNIWLAIPEIEKLRGKPYYKLNDEMLALNLYLIKHNPIAYFKVVYRALTTFLYPLFPPGSEGKMIQQTVWLLIYLIFIFLFICACIYYWYKLARKILFFIVCGNKIIFNPKYILLSVYFLFIIYTAVISSLLDSGQPRFRKPVELFMLSIVIIFSAKMADTIENLRNSRINSDRKS